MTSLPDLVGRWCKRPARLGIALVAAIVVAVAFWAPAVRLELRRSFTRLPTQYAELYFVGAPVIRPYGARSAADVSVTLVDHGATGRDYELRFTLTNPAGAVVSTTAAALPARPEVPATVRQWLKIPDRDPTGPYLVQVALTGQPQTLHYRIDHKGGS